MAGPVSVSPGSVLDILRPTGGLQRERAVSGTSSILHHPLCLWGFCRDAGDAGTERDGPTCHHPFGFCVSCIFLHLLIKLIFLICKQAPDVSEGQLLKDPHCQVPEGFLGWNYLAQSPGRGRHQRGAQD